MKKNFMLVGILSVVTLFGFGFHATDIKAEEDAQAVTVVEGKTKDVKTEVAVVVPAEKSDGEKVVAEQSPPEIVAEKQEATAKEETKNDTEETVLEEDQKVDSNAKQKEVTEEKKVESDAEAAPKPLVIDGLVLTDAERKVFELTNVERRKRGLPALRLERRLMESARRQANWMARTGVFQHGRSGFAENIAMGQPNSLAVVIAWMNSSGHFRNMMSGGHGAIGIGSYRGRGGAIYWCQQFSR